MNQLCRRFDTLLFILLLYFVGDGCAAGRLGGKVYGEVSRVWEGMHHTGHLDKRFDSKSPIELSNDVVIFAYGPELQI